MAERYEITRGTAPTWAFFFNLIAPNNEKILHSEGYTTKQSAQIGIASCRLNCSDDKNYRRGKAIDGQFYFTLLAANGEKIGMSETYKTEASRETGIAACKKYGPGAPVKDLT